MDSFMGKQQTSRVVEVCTAQRQMNRLSEACNQCMHVSTVRDNQGCDAEINAATMA